MRYVHLAPTHSFPGRIEARRSGHVMHTVSHTLLFCRTHRVMISSSSDKETCARRQRSQGRMCQTPRRVSHSIYMQQEDKRASLPRDFCRLPSPCQARGRKKASPAKFLSQPAAGHPKWWEGSANEEVISKGQRRPRATGNGTEVVNSSSICEEVFRHPMNSAKEIDLAPGLGLSSFILRRRSRATTYL
jgi:hypothetical protein